MSRSIGPLMVAGLLLVVGCSLDGGSEVEDDTPFELSLGTDPGNALRADLSFATNSESQPVIEVLDPDGDGFRLTLPMSDAGEHEVPLLGLAPDTTYNVQVTAGGETDSITLTTGLLPEDMPPIEITQSDPDRMTPGLTLFDVIPFGGAAAESGPTEDGYLMAVDEQGQVVWYYRQTHPIQDVRRTDAGDLLFIHHETGVKRLDVVDDTIEEWSGTVGLDTAPEDAHGRPYATDEALRVETDQMHHEVIELPNGNLMTLSREVAEIDGFPEDLCDEGEDFTGTYEVATDTVVEFDPDDGSVIEEWSLFDYVSPLDDLDRIRVSEFCGQYLADDYPEEEARDWTHANAVILDEKRNALLISVRHLDQVFAIRYEDDEEGAAGELLWRLGEAGNFELTGGEWFLHPHAPQVLEDGTIMIYDNGNERPGTSLDDPDRLPYSRAVRYEIDEENLTATQVWENRLDSPGEVVYAPFVGDADSLDGGTVLVTHGGLLDPPAHTPQDEGVLVWGRIVEVDYASGDVLFDLEVKDPAGETGWIIYRAERIPTIYPPGYTVEEIGG